VGVLPESFDFGAVFSPGLKVDMFDPQKMDDIRSEGNTLTLIGRLKPESRSSRHGLRRQSCFRSSIGKRSRRSRWAYKDRARPIWLQEYVSGAVRRL